MRTERIRLAPAYLLHQHAWRETSRVLEVWSREHGRIGLVARGARRPRSPFRGLLQPFLPLSLSWSQRGELGTLTGIEAAAAAPVLRGRALMAAFYLNELLLRLLPRQDAHPALYDSYAATLSALAAQPRPAAPLRIFEKHLLSALGYGLNLEHLAGTQQPVQADAEYRYDLDAGPVPVERGHSGGIPVGGRALLALLGLFGLPRTAMNRSDRGLEDAEDLRAVRRLLKAALERHLDGRPLKTPGVMRAMAKEPKTVRRPA